MCRKESSKSKHRPSAQHWGSPPTTSSQLLGVFRPSGTKREDREGSGCAEFPVVGQQGANNELCVSPTLLLRGCSPAGSDLNPKPGAAQPLPHSLPAPSCLFSVPSKLSTAGMTFISGTASQSLESMARRCAQGARLLGQFPASGPKADPACSFLQPCSDDPAPGKAARGAGIVLGLENGLSCGPATISSRTCPIPQSPAKVLPQGDPWSCKDRNLGESQNAHRQATL